MPLIAIIIISLVIFVYFKVQQARVIGPVQKGWYAAKSSISVGIFFIAFGVNSYNSLGSTVAAYVALLFVVFGLINVYFGIKNHRALSPIARKELEEEKKAETK